MIYTTNINIAVDVVAALSDKSLKGNVFLMDNGSFESANQGTDHLTTLCIPGQLIRWTVYAVDLQTPVAIKNITFLNHSPICFTPFQLSSPPAPLQRKETQDWVNLYSPIVLNSEEYIKEQVEEEIPFEACFDNKTVSAEEILIEEETLTDDKASEAGLHTTAFDQELNKEIIAEDKASMDEKKAVFDYDNLDRFDWTGYVPLNLVPELEYNYRLELQMGEGKYSNLSIETSSLKRI